MANTYKTEIKQWNGSDFDRYHPKTEASIVITNDGASVEDKFNQLYSTADGYGANMVGVPLIDGAIGGTNLYNVLKTLFQFANNGKTAIANAVNTKGVSASPSDTFPTLASKIGQIKTGYSSGDLIKEQNFRYDHCEIVSNKVMPPNGRVSGSCVDSNNNIYISWNFSNRFEKRDVSGNIIWTKKDVPRCGQLRLDGNNNPVIIFDYNSLVKYDPNGNQVWTYAQPKISSGMTIAPSGNIYITRAGSDEIGLEKISSSGSTQWTKQGFFSPWSVAVDSWENIYVACNVWGNNGNNNIWKLNRDGNVIWSINWANMAISIATDSTDSVYVAYNDGVRKINPDGQIIWTNTSYPKGTVMTDLKNNVYCISSKKAGKLDSSGKELWTFTDVVYAFFGACNKDGTLVFIGTDNENWRIIKSENYYRIV